MVPNNSYVHCGPWFITSLSNKQQSTSLQLDETHYLTVTLKIMLKTLQIITDLANTVA